MTKQLEKFIDESTWTFAKTMPEEPHFYTVRSKENEEDFVALVQYIRTNGYQAHYEDFPQEFTYLEYNGYRYWTMGDPISETMIINRCEMTLYKKIETSNGIKILLSDRYYAPWKKLDDNDKFIATDFPKNELFYQLEYIIEKVKDRKNIGLDLVDLLVHEDFIKLIHKEAESQLNLEILGRWAKCREMILISLSIIALLKYDGSFYEYVSEEYVFLYDHFSPQKIEGTIRIVLNWYCETEGVRKSNSRIINVALRNALVPAHFLSAFFEFIFDIYKVNFDCNLPEKLDEEFQFVYEGLRKNMLSSGDEIQINVTKKTYKLIETTKQLIAGGLAVDSIIELSIRIVQIIDNWYWERENPIKNPYFKEGYDEWSAKRRIERDEKKVKRKSPEPRSRWEPRYQIEGDNIYLVPPMHHRVKAQYDYTDLSICIKNQGETIYIENAPHVKEIIGGYQVSVDKIKLENPLGEIQYLLLAGQDEIYNSKVELFRSFLVFNANGEEIHNNTDYNGTAIICAKPNMLHPYFSSEYYGLTDKNIHEGDFIFVGKEAFSFSSFDKPDVFGEIIEHQYLKNKKRDEVLKVFSRVEILAFDSEIGGNYEVVINNTPHKLSDFHYKKKERQNSEQIIINLDFIELGINDIIIYRLFKGSRKKVASFEFGYDPDFRKEISKNSDSNYSVYVSTALCENSIETELDINNFSEDWLTVKRGEEEYSYLLPMPFTLYRIQGKRWQPVWKDLWIEDISNDSIMEVYGVEIDGLTVSGDSGVPLQKNLLIKNKKWYGEIAIGFLLSYKESNKYIKLTFLNAGWNKKAVYCYNQCVLNEEMTEIMFNAIEKELVISPHYKGCGNVALEITEQDGTLMFFKEQLQFGETIRIDGMRSFEKYQILFFEKRKGLSLQKNRELMKKILIVCSTEELCGRFYRIKEVQFDQMVHGKFLRKTHSFHTVYVYFSEQIADGKFSGLIANKVHEKMYGLSNINPVEIELCGAIIVDSEMELSITKDGDGLFLDFGKHGIKNTLEDKKGTDIFSYFIDMKGVKTI